MQAPGKSGRPVEPTIKPPATPTRVSSNGRSLDHDTLTRDENMHPSTSMSLKPLPPGADSCLVNGYLSTILSDNLFTHFNMNVAPRLTWVDSPDHPWRKVMFPLAQCCACLRLSILSVAAAHLSFTAPRDQPNMAQVQAMNHRLRDASLRTLNHQIRVELNKSILSHGPHENSSLTEILATTLVLCYGEMLVPNSTDWNLHLRACRVLIERHKWRSRANETPDAATDFLIKEVSDIEVFRTFGAFTKDQSPVVTLPPRTMLDSHFGAFTGLLWEVTMEERHRHDLLENGHPLPPIDMTTWRSKMEHAYTRASTDTAWLSTTHGDDTQKWMDSIVRAVYHASLIYCYQALTPLEATESVGTSMSLLIQEIEFVTAGTVHILSHDIFLPLFIAGTECWAYNTRQNAIERLFLDLVSATGLWCNHTAIQFLKAFWARTEYHGVGGWIQFARENEADNGPFLIF